MAKLLPWVAVIMPFLLVIILISYFVFADIDLPEASDLVVPPLAVSSNENGFNLVAFAADEIFWESTERRLMGTVPGSEYWDDVLAERIGRRHAEFITRLDEALARPTFIVSGHWDDRDHLRRDWWELHHVLRVRALARLGYGDIDAALDDALRIIRFAQKVKGARVPLVVYTTGTGIGSGGYFTLGRVISTISECTKLRHVQKELCRLEPQRKWLVASVKVEYGRVARKIDSIGVQALVPRPSFIDRLFFRPNRAKSFLVVQARATINAIERGDFQRIAPIRPLIGWLDMTHSVRDNGARIYQRTAIQERVAHRLTQILIALRLHYLEEGVLPRDLELLVPRYLESVPVSPWDGMSLQYSREDQIIHSLGWDRLTSERLDCAVGYESNEFAMSFEFR